MADRIHRVPENVPGRFYVDVTCIDCDLCRETAPLNFQRDDAGRRSYVYHQPADPAQEAACMAALEECPVEAIGRDELRVEAVQVAEPRPRADRGVPPSVSRVQPSQFIGVRYGKRTCPLRSQRRAGLYGAGIAFQACRRLPLNGTFWAGPHRRSQMLLTISDRIPYPAVHSSHESANQIGRLTQRLRAVPDDAKPADGRSRRGRPDGRVVRWSDNDLEWHDHAL